MAMTHESPSVVIDDEEFLRNSLTGSFSAKYGDLPVWSSDSLTHCEICLREFTFRRRRHHCRKCGCIICYKCSTQSIVIPRLGKDLHRVCDSCYNNVHSDPCSELFDDLSEINYQEKIKNEALRVSVITTSDVVAQAIVQGISIALTGSPLGKEIDIHCFPTPDLALYTSDTLEYDPDSPSALYNPPPSSLPPGILSRHSISPHYLSYPSPTSLHSVQNLSFLRNSMNHAHDQGPSSAPLSQENIETPPKVSHFSPQSIRDLRPPLLETNDHDSKISACQKAKLAYNLYQERFGRSCHYAVGIVFCVEREMPFEHEIEGINEQEDPFLTTSASYHIYYWIAIYDGSLLNTSRSTSVVLPPSLCAHIQRKNTPIRTSLGAERGTDESYPKKPPLPPHSEYNYEIDIEEELIAAILRLDESNENGLLSPAPLNSNKNSHFSITHALSGGIVGWLTAGKITRAHYLQSAIQLAFIPFQWKDLFEVTDV